MSTTFTSIFDNDTRAEGVRSVHAARGSGRHHSLLDHVQSRAARQAAAHREVVEQRVVYSIYYNGTLVLPWRGERGVALAGWCLGESGVRTRDVIILAYGSTSLYTVLGITCHNYTA